jgi:ABC transporter DrrB family efflux protein
MRRGHPLLQLFLARLREFYREPAVLFWVYGFPLFLAIALGLAFSGGQPLAPALDLQETPEVDIQQTPAEAEAVALQQHLETAGLITRLESADAAHQRLRTGKAALVIVPDAGGYRYLYDPRRSDSILARYRADDVVQRWKAGSPAWQTRDGLVEEPGDRYIDFLIPGLMGLNLMGGGLWGVGYVVVDMRVRKLLKRLLATPMRPRDFLLSILGSRLVFLVTEMLLLAGVGCLGFGVPIRGNVLVLALTMLLGGAAFSGLGLLLGCRTEKTETVSGLINLLMLPMWMFCGTFFTPRRFPTAVQPLIEALPLTQLNDALRGVMLEGAAFGQVAERLAILAAWAVVPFLLALRWFRWH